MAKTYCEMLGFLPAPSVQTYAERGGVFRATQNGQDCGFTVACFNPISQPGTLKIYQHAIAKDSIRRQHGLHLFQTLRRLGREAKCDTITAWCLEDLDSNHFWRAAGFVPVGLVSGGNKRGQRLIGWAYALDGRAIGDTDRRATEALMRRVRRIKRDLWREHQHMLFDELELPIARKYYDRPEKPEAP